MTDVLKTTVALTTIQAAYGDSLEQVRERLAPLLALTEYRDVVKGIGQCRQTRVALEERRKLLKADSLEFGRNVDAVAKALTDAVAQVEKELQRRKAVVDEQKAKAKADKEAAEAAERARIAKEAAEAELAQQRQEHEDRRKSIEKMQREASAEVAKERAKLDQLRAEVDSDWKAAEAAKAEAQREAEVARAELRQLIAEREAAQTRARLAAEAEENRLAAEAHEKRLEAQRALAEPDKSKLISLAHELTTMFRVAPGFRTEAAKTLFHCVKLEASKLSDALSSFDGTELSHD